MKIRKAAESDKEQVLKLAKRLYYRMAPRQYAYFKKNWGKIKRGTLVASSGKQIIAYLAFGIRGFPKLGKTLYIGDIYVLPDWRRKGIGKKLVRKTERVKKALKLRWLTVDAWKKGMALKFYKKLGFEIWKEKNPRSWRLIKG